MLRQGIPLFVYERLGCCVNLFTYYFLSSVFGNAFCSLRNVHDYGLFFRPLDDCPPKEPQAGVSCTVFMLSQHSCVSLTVMNLSTTITTTTERILLENNRSWSREAVATRSVRH